MKSSIAPEDVAFARAVVALARLHEMDRVQMSFFQNFDLSRRSINNEKKTVTWSAGRHGDQARITFNLTAEASFDEQESDHGK